MRCSICLDVVCTMFICVVFLWAPEHLCDISAGVSGDWHDAEGLFFLVRLTTAFAAAVSGVSSFHEYRLSTATCLLYANHMLSIHSSHAWPIACFPSTAIVRTLGVAIQTRKSLSFCVFLLLFPLHRTVQN